MTLRGYPDKLTTKQMDQNQLNHKTYGPPANLTIRHMDQDQIGPPTTNGPYWTLRCSYRVTAQKIRIHILETLIDAVNS